MDRISITNFFSSKGGGVLDSEKKGGLTVAPKFFGGRLLVARHLLDSEEFSEFGHDNLGSSMHT